MFHLDITLEDLRIIGELRHDNQWALSLHNNLSGDGADILIPAADLGPILAAALHPDGDVQRLTTEEVYSKHDALELPHTMRILP